MSKAKPHQGLEHGSSESAPEGAGDIRAAMGEVREQIEETLRLQFAQAERTVAARMQERLAGADALIARLTAENQRLQEENDRHERSVSSADALIARLTAENQRLQDEVAKHERTLARMRELALSSP